MLLASGKVDWRSIGLISHHSRMARHKPKPQDPVADARVAFGPDPLPNVSPRVEAEVARLSKQVRLYVRRDIEEQKEAVERLMVEGAYYRQIVRILRQRWPNISRSTVTLRINQVNALRAAERKATREELRDHAVERLQMMRQRALAGNNPNFKAAIACEKEIAKIQGLYAPTKVEVDGDMRHSHAMLSVIANMDPELAGNLLEEAREEKRLAAKARELLPGLIDSKSETEPR